MRVYRVTRLHSSRMCTTRVLTVSPSMLCTGGCLLGGCTWSGGVSALGVYLVLGGVCSQMVYLVPGVSAWGVYLVWGVSAPRGCLLQGGVSAPGGVRYSPVNRMTIRCKNITLSQTSFAGGNNYDGVWGQQLMMVVKGVTTGGRGTGWGGVTTDGRGYSRIQNSKKFESNAQVLAFVYRTTGPTISRTS